MFNVSTYIVASLNVPGCNIGASSARPGLIFQRQAPKQTQADLERHIRQYTKAEVVLSETDIYEDGKPRAPEFKSQLTNLVSTEGEFVRFECQLAPVNDPNL